MSIPELLIDGWIYWLIFLWLILAVWLESSKVTSKNKHLISVVSATIFTIFIGLRWETGTDWDNYKRLFDTIELNWDFLLNIYHFDIGYVLLNAFVKYFTNSYSVFLLIDSAITIGSLYFLLKKATTYPNVSWLIFYSNFMIIQFMGSNRRMISMVLILWVIYYIANGSKIKAILSNTLAFLFHRSSIINVFLFFVSDKIFSLRKIVITFSLCLLVGISQLIERIIEIIASLLSFAIHIPLVELLTFYSENGEDHLVNATGSLLLSTILALGKRLVFLCFYWRLIKRCKNDRIAVIFFNVYVIGIACYLALIGSFFQILTAYWALAEVILIGRIYKYSYSKEKLFFCCMLIGFGVLQITNALNVYPELYIPYKIVL